MSELFARIAGIQPLLPGWCSPEKAEALAAMVLSLRPEVSVEIGVFGGSSFIPIALAHQEIGMGIATGIDPWEVHASIRNETPENIEWWGKLDHESIFRGFMAKLKELRLESCTNIVRQTSDEAPAPVRIDLLHIDGSHTDQAMRDVVKFATKVRPGGLCVMDDLDWPAGRVRLAEARLLQFSFKLLYPLGTGGVYQRV